MDFQFSLYEDPIIDDRQPDLWASSSRRILPAYAEEAFDEAPLAYWELQIQRENEERVRNLMSRVYQLHTPVQCARQSP